MTTIKNLITITAMLALLTVVAILSCIHGRSVRESVNDFTTNLPD